jgi:enterochelin esterase family protein
MKRLLVTAALCAWTLGAQTHPLQELIEAARAKAPELKDLLAKRSPNLGQGGVWVWGQDFLFAAQSDGALSVSIDAQPAVMLSKIAGSNLSYRLVKMRTGVTHSYQFLTEGKPLGTRRDVAGYNPDSYPKPGVPKGTLSEKKVITSKVYPGATADYWIYASPGVDPAKPSALMVWQDGQGIINGDLSNLRLFTVTENLIAQKLLPPMVHVMISPATVAAQNQPNRRSLRSIQYDTLSDLYGRYLMDEVLPEVEKVYKLRPEGYSRAIAGESSGAICAFNVAWFFPDKFSRVHSAIGSYTSIQWRPDDKQDGGNVYPFRLRRDAKKNIRVWMSDGVEDIENQFGSWPLQNLQFANSLKMKGYDYHFRLGEAAHNGSQAALDLPESLAWLWRDYDPAKTDQAYEQDPAEKEKPLYRIKTLNRDAW